MINVSIDILLFMNELFCFNFLMTKFNNSLISKFIKFHLQNFIFCSFEIVINFRNRNDLCQKIFRKLLAIFILTENTHISFWLLNDIKYH